MSHDPDCLGMCAIDDDVCTGCGRTLDQINAALAGEGDDVPARPAGGTSVHARTASGTAAP
ncbi:DUF1289 domain-containing protein [Azospirillum doebereinerae]|nr:DUF1289 domain-containing protein [Azospirillum doebereinerae]MCG5243021.1 DUF1289 domain-containing protein [Azospirillum doebereinerae]